MTDENWILESIKPKSDQLNADDLISGPIDVTIQDVKQCPDEKQPVAIVIGDNRQPYKPCKSMRRVMVALWGDQPKKWIGKRMRLYCDGNVMFGGLRVGGIRISHATIEESKDVLLTTAKAKRTVYTIHPLKDEKPDTETRIGKAIKALEDAKTIEAHDKLTESIERVLIPICNVDQRKRLVKASQETGQKLHEASNGKED
jgi:hypothetical protein